MVFCHFTAFKVMNSHALGEELVLNETENKCGEKFESVKKS